MSVQHCVLTIQSLGAPADGIETQIKMIDAFSSEKRLNQCGDHQLNQKRQVKLKTCADVYEHWRSYKRLYKKAPKEGVEFHIDYIDTGLAMSEEERARAPIALALHGAPGSYHDFSLLINHLAAQRVRVVAPNFPEYIATVKTKVLFRHSADEKAAYLRDFLKAIGITKIDLLVSHSSAIFPTLLILLNANDRAIARRKEQQECANNGEKSKVKTTTTTTIMASGKGASSSSVTIDALSEAGLQIKGDVVGLCDAATEGLAGSRSIDSETDSGHLESEEPGDYNEPFEDATETLDDNNNQNDLAKGQLDNDGLVIDLRQLDVDGELIGRPSANDHPTGHEAAGQEQTDDETSKGTRFKQRRRRRRAQDVIVRFDEPIEIKAVALFNPAGHRLPKSMKPTWFKCGSVHVYQHKFGRSLFRKFGPAFLTVVGVPVRVDNMDNVMLSATVMRNSKCQRVVKQLEQLSQLKIPTLLVFSENDKLIEKEIFYEMTQFMHLDSRKFDVFNNDGDIELSRK